MWQNPIHTTLAWHQRVQNERMISYILQWRKRPFRSHPSPTSPFQHNAFRNALRINLLSPSYSDWHPTSQSCVKTEILYEALSTGTKDAIPFHSTSMVTGFSLNGGRVALYHSTCLHFPLMRVKRMQKKYV